MSTRLGTVSMRVMLAAGLFALSGARAASTEVFSAKLVGDNEVPPTASTATGTFHMEIDNSTTTPTINFTMTYANMSGNPTVSHLHFGQFNVAGGVMIFLCGGGGQPSCPASTSGTFSGTITAANVTGPTAQGISAGDLASALEAVLEGESYANIHSATFPAGELRGQVRRGARGREDN
jgi:CHRD domain